jgi:hypothetical protein
VPLHHNPPRRALRAEPTTAPKPPATSAAAKPAATDKAAAAAKPTAPPPADAPAGADAPDANAAKLAAFGIKRVDSPEGELQELLIGPDSGYDHMSFPWAAFGPANVSINIAFHRVLDVDLYSGAARLFGRCWMSRACVVWWKGCLGRAACHAARSKHS